MSTEPMNAAAPPAEPIVNQTKSPNPWIAGLSSFAIHVLILLVLAAFTLSGSGGGGGSGGFSIDDGNASTDSEAIDSASIEAQGEETPTPASFSPEQISSSDLVTEATPALETTASEVPKISSTISASISDTIRVAGGDKKGTAQSFVNSSFEGRSAKNRASIGMGNGATPASEAAVELALAYLARHQRPNGSWTMRMEDAACHGECDNGTLDLDPHEIAGTGLALLCFLGAGHTMHEGQYSENVNKGVYFLIQNLKQRQTGSSSWLSNVAKAEMYEHGIATLALCEALQMNGDSELLTKPCQETVNFIVSAQHKSGGWDYHPNGAAGDLSIVGWQMMALKSAVSAKLAVNAEPIRGIDAFLNQHVRGEFMFVYNQGQKPREGMTAIGTLMRIYRGWSRTDPAIVKAIEYLGKKGPSEMDLYYDYYATQAMFQYGDRPWKAWNPRMRDYLISTQEKDGHMAGSWWFPGEPGSPTIIVNRAGGRLYTTTMACLTLEVYYRYLPVNDTVATEFQF